MTITGEENRSIIGRDQINDVEAILSTPMVDPDEVLHVVKNEADSIFTWDYSLARPQLRKLYEKAKVDQKSTRLNSSHSQQSRMPSSA